MRAWYAWWLGFIEHIRGRSDCGRTWPDDQDCNEAYDRGWNFADFIRRKIND